MRGRVPERQITHRVNILPFATKSSGLTYASVLRIPTTSEETTKYSASYSKETTAYPQFDLFDEFRGNRVNGDPMSHSKKWAYDNKYLDSSSRLYNNNYHNYHKKNQLEKLEAAKAA